MDSISSSRATQLLNRMQAGDGAAANQLMPLLYEELHSLARIHMTANPARHTLQPTALVNEAWLKIAGNDSAHFENRTAFFAYASRVMRSVLVDHARGKQARKRSAGGVRVTLNDDTPAPSEREVDLLAMDEALLELTQLDPALGKIVEMRFFGGLTAEETALAMGMSLRSLERSWKFARMWLFRRLGDGTPA